MLPAWLYSARPALIFALLALIPFGIAGSFLGLARFYIYGVLVGLSPLADDWLSVYVQGGGFGLTGTLGVAAVVVVLTGLVVFLRFLRENPLPPEDVTV